MDDFQIPKIDPEIVKISNEITERKKQEAKKQYLRDHFFQIYNAITSTVAILVAIAALIVSIVSLNFSKGDPPSEPRSDLETAQAQTDAR